MSELLKEMCTMSGRLSPMINKVKPVANRVEVWTRYLEINSLIERLVGKEFDQKEQFYCETLDKIKESEIVINRYRGNPDDLIQVKIHISNIIADVEKIITLWEMDKKK